MKGRLNEVELCLVEGFDYVIVFGFGESCCKFIFKFIDYFSGVYGKLFRLFFLELNVFDFLVEKIWYDVLVSRSWIFGDMCLVWWRNENGEGGNWWEGWIVFLKLKFSDYFDSLWERYVV